MDDLRIAKANKRAADAAEKQALARIAEILQEELDDVSEPEEFM